MRYRPEIDGLRALAVLPVLFYHAGIPGFSGGFVGVDVFFVISGYLITSIILKEIEAGTFTLSHFWERRARRILPALFTVIISCFIAGWFFLLPGDYKELGDSALAQSFFVSNVFFWRKVGYFATAAETKPLLHTWSLSVEEQFYIFFPLLLLVFSKFCSRKNLLKFVMAGLVLSLTLCIWIQHSKIAFELSPIWFDNAGAAFYLLPTRMWELLIGAALTFSPIALNFNRRATFGVFGIFGILTAIVFYNDQTIFPGYTALLPCMGAALILWSNERKVNIVGRFLSLKPLNFIGKISYSLYLWHWPLLAFPQYWLDRKLSILEACLALTITFFLSILSLKYIEMPFR
ncbi:MAG: acyltransferase, partial [bacterium]|nr:acyltransferase [bacterium]